VTQTDATPNATINPQHLDTTYYFNYGRSGAYGVSAPATPVDMGARAAPEAVTLDLATTSVVLHPGTGSRSLEPNTVYHFQVVARNEAGTTEGSDETFITLPPAPAATTGSASPVNETAATLSGVVDPGSAGPNSDTTWHFQYGRDATYESGSVPLSAGDAGMGTAAVPVSAQLRGLVANTPYHYRLVASNDNANPVGAPQLTNGSDHTFTTLPTEPLIDRPSDMNATTATLNGLVDPTGSDLRYRFEYGPTIAYGQDTPIGDAGAGATTISVSATVNGLTPGATYHARLVAMNAAGGESPSEDVAFTLIAPPPPAGANEFRPGPSASPPTGLSLLSISAFPSLLVPTAPSQRPTSSRQLARALRACRRESKKRRARCEAAARHRYGRRSK
jgi:hypothetical protein